MCLARQSLDLLMLSSKMLRSRPCLLIPLTPVCVFAIILYPSVVKIQDVRSKSHKQSLVWLEIWCFIGINGCFPGQNDKDTVIQQISDVPAISWTVVWINRRCSLDDISSSFYHLCAMISILLKSLLCVELSILYSVCVSVPDSNQCPWSFVFWVLRYILPVYIYQNILLCGMFYMHGLCLQGVTRLVRHTMPTQQVLLCHLEDKARTSMFTRLLHQLLWLVDAQLAGCISYALVYLFLWLCICGNKYWKLLKISLGVSVAFSSDIAVQCTPCLRKFPNIINILSDSDNFWQDQVMQEDVR